MTLEETLKWVDLPKCSAWLDLDDYERMAQSDSLSIRTVWGTVAIRLRPLEFTEAELFGVLESL